MKLVIATLAGFSILGFSLAPAQAAKKTHPVSHGSAGNSSIHPGEGHPETTDFEEIREIIAKHAAANGVPFKLADAVVRIESTYQPLVSNGGALGLMQIKPGTARELGFVGTAGELYHPETNIHFGMKYLGEVYRKSGGDLCDTVMRYQSGAYAKHRNAANRAYCAKARDIMARG